MRLKIKHVGPIEFSGRANDAVARAVTRAEWEDRS